MHTAPFAAVLERLEQKATLNDLPLAMHNGRVDLRRSNLAAIGSKRSFGEPVVRQLRPTHLPGMVLGEYAGWVVRTCAIPLELRGLELRDIDFTGSHLDGIRFHGCTITNCVFDDTSCKGWRLWTTSIRDSTFARATLRDAALGGIVGDTTNHFENVLFASTDLRGTSHKAASFIACVFDHANLYKVEFQGSRFTKCVFRGELREVMFFDHAFRGEAFSPNEMEDVDFSAASLRDVDFRGLNLDRVRFPADNKHFVVSNYRAALDYALAQLRDHRDKLSARMRVQLDHQRKWIGPQQQVGVFNRLDLLDFFGEEGRAKFERLLNDGSR